MNALAFASSWPPGFFEVTGLYSGSADDDALADDEDALVELEEAEDEDTFADDGTSWIGSSEDCEAPVSERAHRHCASINNLMASNI
ncbi:hypothetical protein AB0H58_32825 [Nocardia neocaledoniensis]|uniref:hypothetical protein n=1 Tax=Nocardia neocaledoniensis TaxID=236511 RepID=UPI0033C1B4B0